MQLYDDSQGTNMKPETIFTLLLVFSLVVSCLSAPWRLVDNASGEEEAAEAESDLGQSINKDLNQI